MKSHEMTLQAIRLRFLSSKFTFTPEKMAEVKLYDCLAW